MLTERQATLIKTIQEAMHETALAFFFTDIGLKDGPAITLTQPDLSLIGPANVTATVRFRGPIEGGIHLSAPCHAAIGLAQAFTGDPIDSLNETARDAMGELTNILAGALKSRISDHIDLTPPEVVEGAAIPFATRAEIPEEHTRCYFLTVNGPLFVEVFHQGMEG
ncbi:MAG: chemotaxis protein CheX [Magnetococcales bacterium]|nr:chemotaxis protein CheX [Magnetococcales bacterium]NGZ07531.1 chemotaxis protein CheX [Magnetococcales bacterium]